jgi:hypothetical protein
MPRVAIHTDDFNRADGPLGAGWQTVNASGYDIYVQTNSARCTANGTVNRAASTAVGYTADQYAQDSLANVISPYCGSGLMVRCDYSGTFLNSCYEISGNSSQGDFWRRKKVANAWTEIGWGGQAHTFAVNDVVRYEVEGSTQRVYFNDVLFETWSDFSLSGAPSVGTQTTPGIAQDPMGNYGSRVDNWEGGNITANPASNVPFYRRSGGAWSGNLPGYVRSGGAWVRIAGTAHRRTGGAWS